ncbi:uncharacterized protein DUF3298 [Mobilisporobacter senegalensis]|uniref:Uncharacterized protein DUF3298 n=1 Tax=Mobilisporobacter senegalensis TaxID=1329262 RepID=A0A3N1XLB3_9FIRM|nr:RsiV family protein [Mobilisporobacter senegalensis]ROR27493.1 uncharacterized protein DUF3298 [Mobilisporobacter senegalensis]
MKKKTQSNYIKDMEQIKEVKSFKDAKEMDDLKYMNDMKKEYNDIIIPAALKNKVEESIMKGKKDNMKKNTIQVMKSGIITAAAALLAIVILANSNQSIAHAMKNIPIIGAITNVVTFRTYKDKTKDFEANIEVPKIETDDKDENIKKAAEEVNKSVEDYTNMLIEQYETDMEASEGEGHYAVDTSYQVITDNDKIFTLRIDTVVAMGGSNSFSKFYHIDKQSGNIFTLKDVFKENTDYIKVISENIKKQMREQMAADESITYFFENEETKEWNFEEIKVDQNFYFNKNEELVIVFDKYEVAPGYMGMVEFTIPAEAIKDIIN